MILKLACVVSTLAFTPLTLLSAQVAGNTAVVSKPLIGSSVKIRINNDPAVGKDGALEMTSQVGSVTTWRVGHDCPPTDGPKGQALFIGTLYAMTTTGRQVTITYTNTRILGEAAESASKMRKKNYSTRTYTVNLMIPDYGTSTAHLTSDAGASIDVTVFPIFNP